MYIKAICYGLIHRFYDVLDFFDRVHWRFHDWAEDTIAFHEGGYEALVEARAKRSQEMMALLSEVQHEQTAIPFGEGEGHEGSERTIPV